MYQVNCILLLKLRPYGECADAAKRSIVAALVGVKLQHLVRAPASTYRNQFFQFFTLYVDITVSSLHMRKDPLWLL